MDKTIATLNKLIDEVNKLCDTVKEDNKELKQKLREKKAYNYLMFCTDLAPYYEIAKKLGTTIIVHLDNDYTIQFYRDRVAVSPIRNQSDVRYLGVNCYYISNVKDFVSYGSLMDLGKTSVDKMIESWNCKEFEEKFSIEVQKILTEKAKSVTQENEELKKEIRR